MWMFSDKTNLLLNLMVSYVTAGGIFLGSFANPYYRDSLIWLTLLTVALTMWVVLLVRMLIDHRWRAFPALLGAPFALIFPIQMIRRLIDCTSWVCLS
jgi:hypothetical protein